MGPTISMQPRHQQPASSSPYLVCPESRSSSSVDPSPTIHEVTYHRVLTSSTCPCHCYCHKATLPEMNNS